MGTAAATRYPLADDEARHGRRVCGRAGVGRLWGGDREDRPMLEEVGIQSDE